MKRNIFYLVIFCLSCALVITGNAQTPKAKQTPKETTKSAATEWPECCWVGKTTEVVTPALPEQPATTPPATEASSGAATGASSGAGFTSSSGEESEEETSEEAAEKGKNPARKLAGAALKALTDKIKNKDGETSESSETTEASTTNSTSSEYIGETEKNVTTATDGSVQEVKRPNNATRRQRIQAMRERNGNATATTTDATTTAEPLNSVQEIKRPGAAARRRNQQQNSADANNASATETPVNRVRRNQTNANAPVDSNAATSQSTPAPTHNPPRGGPGMNAPKIAVIRAARQNKQNAPPQPRRTPRQRPNP
jgi:hypothetical protein